MPDIAIHAERIGKQFRIGTLQNVRNFREVITDGFMAPFRRAGKLFKGQAAGGADPDDTMWALENISFEIKQGEAVGIIGRNGAGKSTLLKILSRITEPTTGFVDTCGRIGSLLEVGTGFHPELTGRENIFLNGAILGMTKADIHRKFDEIVAFSEVERFIDTPVKHYSSGMYLRLAFAVAAHLEPDILIIDEVLAVGDNLFQKKCLNKMQDVEMEGRTVLFVSHNIPAVTKLCERIILIENGRISMDGPSHQVASKYMTGGQGPKAVHEWSDSRSGKAPENDIARLRAVRVKTEDGQTTGIMDIRQPLLLEMEFEVLKPGYVLLPHFELCDGEGAVIFTTLDQDPIWRGLKRAPGRYVSAVRIPGNLLSEGMVFVCASNITLYPTMVQFDEPNAVAFQVIDSYDGNSARGNFVGELSGIVRPLLEWNTKYDPNG